MHYVKERLYKHGRVCVLIDKKDSNAVETSFSLTGAVTMASPLSQIWDVSGI